MITEAKARTAKARDKRYRLQDADGLMLEVRPNGKKSWVLRYMENGKRKDKTIGAYPALSLREARQTTADVLLQIQRGEQPFTQKNVGLTFRDVGLEFLDDKAKRVVPGYHRTLKLRFNKYLFPALGAREMKDINLDDARELLLEIAKTRNETARKLYGLLSELFRFAALRGYVSSDPISPLKGLIQKNSKLHYPFISDKKKLGEVLRLIKHCTASIPIALELQILPHIFVRPSELRLATWDEIDITDAVLKIPASRMKMGRVHWVPLSKQVLELLYQLRTVVGDSGFLFPGARYGRPHSESLLNISLKNLGIGSDIIVPHGFRHTASTMLHEMGFNHAYIEKQLAHEQGSTVSAVYNHAEYLPQRREMMQAWSDFLDSLCHV